MHAFGSKHIGRCDRLRRKRGGQKPHPPTNPGQAADGDHPAHPADAAHNADSGKRPSAAPAVRTVTAWAAATGATPAM